MFYIQSYNATKNQNLLITYNVIKLISTWQTSLPQTTANWKTLRDEFDFSS